MRARDYFMREGQSCASTGNKARLALALFRAPSKRERDWIRTAYHQQTGAFRKLINRASERNKHEAT